MLFRGRRDHRRACLSHQSSQPLYLIRKIPAPTPQPLYLIRKIPAPSPQPLYLIRKTPAPSPSQSSAQIPRQQQYRPISRCDFFGKHRTRRNPAQAPSRGHDRRPEARGAIWRRPEARDAIWRRPEARGASGGGQKPVAPSGGGPVAPSGDGQKPVAPSNRVGRTQLSTSPPSSRIESESVVRCRRSGLLQIDVCLKRVAVLPASSGDWAEAKCTRHCSHVPGL